MHMYINIICCSNSNYSNDVTLEEYSYHLRVLYFQSEEFDGAAGNGEPNDQSYYVKVIHCSGILRTI